MYIQKNPARVIKQNFNFECSLCLEEYDNDRKFPMIICIGQHNACQQCVESTLFKKDHQDKCPQCRKTIYKNQVSKFRYLNKIQETFKELQAQTRDTRKQIKQKDKEIQMYLAQIKRLQKMNKQYKSIIDQNYQNSRKVTEQKQNLTKKIKDQKKKITNHKKIQKKLEKQKKTNEQSQCQILTCESIRQQPYLQSNIKPENHTLKINLLFIFLLIAWAINQLYNAPLDFCQLKWEQIYEDIMGMVFFLIIFTHHRAMSQTKINRSSSSKVWQTMLISSSQNMIEFINILKQKELITEYMVLGQLSKIILVKPQGVDLKKQQKGFKKWVQGLPKSVKLLEFKQGEEINL